MTKTTYETINPTDVPADLRWDVSPRDAGLAVEVAYADYPTQRGPAGYASDPRIASEYRRVVDRSDGSVTYGRLARR